ncbi:hypothetical protein BH11PAT2_BH11PAT2_05810 [soil metagenome]
MPRNKRRQAMTERIDTIHGKLFFSTSIGALGDSGGPTSPGAAATMTNYVDSTGLRGAANPGR